MLHLIDLENVKPFKSCFMLLKIPAVIRIVKNVTSKRSHVTWTFLTCRALTCLQGTEAMALSCLLPLACATFFEFGVDLANRAWLVVSNPIWEIREIILSLVVSGKPLYRYL